MAYNHNNHHTHSLYSKGKLVCPVFGEIATKLNGDVVAKDLYTWMNDAGDEMCNCLLDGMPNAQGSYVVPMQTPVPIYAAMIGGE